MDIVVNAFYRVYVRLLLFFSPSRLFRRINRLDWYQQTLHQWTDALGCPPGSTLLELGCGSGELSQHLAGRGARVTAVDRSPGMLQRANEANEHGVRYLRDDVMQLDQPDDAFDTVIAASLVNVVDEPEQLLAQMVRVARHGGTVSVLVPDSAMTDAKVMQLIHDLGLTGFSRASLLTWHRLANKMSATDLVQLFEVSELREVEYRNYLGGMVIGVTGSTP